MKTAALCALLLTVLTIPASTASSPTAKPEDVGMSSARLERIRSLIDGHIAAKDFSGAVTLVARNGKLVHFEARGLADIEVGKPMRTDALFALASMTKPMTAVAALMLMEDGKLVLSDPVSKFTWESRHSTPASSKIRSSPSASA